MGVEEPPDTEAGISEIGALSEPTRRALYFYIAQRRTPVGRDEAAEAVGVSRSLAAFHLDRLADEGLLDVQYKRPAGRSGPGAGRPAKLYTRSAREVEVTLPPRRYALAAELLARAVADPAAAAARRALARTAYAAGQVLAAPVAARLRPRSAAAKRLGALREMLAEQGYEPYAEDGDLRVANCPFHALADEHATLVCGMNEQLVRGAAEALDVPGTVVLDRRPGECCVVVRRTR